MISFPQGNQTIIPMESEDGGSDCFHMTFNRCRWEKFENQWLPFPFFTLGSNGKTDFAPTNWCRCKLFQNRQMEILKNTIYYLLLILELKYESEDFEEEDLMETPVFASNYDKSKDFALCNNEFSLVDFCSKSSTYKLRMG